MLTSEPERPIRTQVVRAALARVRASGGDAAQLIHRFALPVEAETDIEVVLPLRTLHGFLEAAEEATNDTFLGLRMALSFPRGLYGVVEFIARNSSTVKEGLARVVEFASLMTNVVKITFEEREGAGIVEHQIPGEPLACGRHANEFFICALVLQAREVAEVPVAPEAVWFAHPAPADVSELVQELGTSDIQFGRGVSGIRFGADALRLKLRSADPALLSVLDRQAKASLERRPKPVTLTDQVRNIIREQMERGEAVTLQGVARPLALGERTLQRRLNEDGCPFRDAVEAVREELACELLRDRSKGLGEIAYRLGYADLPAFLRAFKRWTGQTPSEYRAAGAGVA